MDYIDDAMCFVCGRRNPIGLKLKFNLQADGTLKTRFTPQKVHQGYADIVHGGIIATVLDEVMVNLPYERGQKAVTARMKVTFKRPVAVGQELIFIAGLTRETRRTLDVHAQAQTANGTVVAEADGTLMKV